MPAEASTQGRAGKIVVYGNCPGRVSGQLTRGGNNYVPATIET